MPGSTQKYQNSLKGEVSDQRRLKSGASSKTDDPRSQKMAKTTIGEHNTTQNSTKVPEEAHDSMYGGVNWETSNALSTFLFGSNSNVNERLLAQTEGQDQPSIQERRNQMRFSVHGWEFLDRKSDDDMQSRGTQRKGDMDALLSQVGTWPVDFGYEYKSDSPEGRTTQLQRGRHEAATKTKKTSNIGPWC